MYSEQWWVYSFLDWRVGPSAAIWYLSISVFIIICFFFQVLVHKFRDWISKKLLLRKYRNQCRPEVSTAESGIIVSSTDTEKPIAVHQNSNFEPLASTIGGGSRITFGESLATNESSIYY
jgi:hypothetical protein